MFALWSCPVRVVKCAENSTMYQSRWAPPTYPTATVYTRPGRGALVLPFSCSNERNQSFCVTVPSWSADVGGAALLLIIASFP